MNKGILRGEVTVSLLLAGEFWRSISQQFIKFHERPGHKEQREGKLTNPHFCSHYVKVWWLGVTAVCCGKLCRPELSVFASGVNATCSLMWVSSKSVSPVESRSKCQKEFSAGSVVASSSLCCLLIKLCILPLRKLAGRMWEEICPQQRKGCTAGLRKLLGSWVPGAFLMLMWCLVGVV